VVPDADGTDDPENDEWNAKGHQTFGRACPITAGTAATDRVRYRPQSARADCDQVCRTVLSTVLLAYRTAASDGTCAASAPWPDGARTTSGL
jgi:hypothetical protein